MLLENLRFHPEEESNEQDFATALATLADVYVNDAFGAAHRAHASVAAHGRALRRGRRRPPDGEGADYLGKALGNPERPFVAILGGAKVSDKIEVIENLLGRVDHLLIGGAMAYTFFKALGLPVGKSLVEDDKLAAALQIIEHAKVQGRGADAAGRSRGGAGARCGSANGGAPGVGPRDRRPDGPRHRAGDARRSTPRSSPAAKTVVWNGPMGVFELAPFAAGTMASPTRWPRCRRRRSSAAATRWRR